MKQFVAAALLLLTSISGNATSLVVTCDPSNPEPQLSLQGENFEWYRPTDSGTAYHYGQLIQNVGGYVDVVVAFDVTGNPRIQPNLRTRNMKKLTSDGSTFYEVLAKQSSTGEGMVMRLLPVNYKRGYEFTFSSTSYSISCGG